jgi:hypothetical protein
MLYSARLISAQQSKPTENTLALVNRLCAYAAAYPDNELVLKATTGMHLHIISDASYLSEYSAGSVAGGLAFIGNKDKPYEINGFVATLCSRIDVVVSSAAEAELAAVYINAQRAVQLRNTLSDLGYPQTATPIQCDNACAVGIANDTIKRDRMKAMDMRWNWIRDRINQGQFTMTWRKGSLNLADHLTKSQPQKSHQAIMPLFVRSPLVVNNFLNKRTQRNIIYKQGARNGGKAIHRTD